MKDKEFKKSELKRIIPIAWNSYQHMYDVRVNNTQNMTNFLLIVISFLPIISLMLLTYFKNIIFLFPIFFQLLSFLILIKVFFIPKPPVNWIEVNLALENIAKEKFDENLFASLKALENETWIYLRESMKIIKCTLYLILFSLYCIILALIFLYFFGHILYFLTISLTVIFLIIVLIYHKSQLNYKYNSNYKKFKEQVEEWLDKPLPKNTS